MKILAVAGSSMVVLSFLWLLHRCAVRCGQRRVREMRKCLWSHASQGEQEAFFAFVRSSIGETGHVEYRDVLLWVGSRWIEPGTGFSGAGMAGWENLSVLTGSNVHPWRTQQTKKEDPPAFTVPMG